MSHHEFTKKRTSTNGKIVCTFCKKKNGPYYGDFVCTFCKKKNGPYYGDFTNLQKNFFLSFKKCETTSNIFPHFEDFSGKLRKQKHIFHFQTAKILNFVHQKKSFLAILQQYIDIY